MILSDLVVATGINFDALVRLNSTQIRGLQEAVLRRWEMEASINGFTAMFGGKKGSGSGLNITEKEIQQTEAFERQIKAMKKATGKNTFTLGEVL